MGRISNKDLKDTLNDIGLDLIDEGFHYHVSNVDSYTDISYVTVTIHNKGVYFNGSSVADVMERLFFFMKSERFAYTTIEPYIERLVNHIEDKYKICLIEVTIPNSRGQASVDMSEWLSKSKEEQENSYVGTMDDEIFSECIIYLEEK